MIIKKELVILFSCFSSYVFESTVVETVSTDNRTSKCTINSSKLKCTIPVKEAQTMKLFGHVKTLTHNYEYGKSICQNEGKKLIDLDLFFRLKAAKPNLDEHLTLVDYSP